MDDDLFHGGIGTRDFSNNLLGTHLKKDTSIPDLPACFRVERGSIEDNLAILPL